MHKLGANDAFMSITDLNCANDLVTSILHKGAERSAKKRSACIATVLVIFLIDCLVIVYGADAAR